ncbi:MAG: hypothetical protein JXR76_09930 [Deltaproteobacteria bacterium]|nr:hypothetical protein [Deltaproteobacteria bacterium]
MAGNITAAGTINKSDENTVVVGGTETPNTSVSVPVIETQETTPGTENITLNNSESRDLPPASYGEVTLRDGATLILNQGTYHFAKFVLDSGNVNLIYNLNDGPIKVFVSDQLSFGDRNIFSFADKEDQAQVQFYTNSTSQIKIGTDSTFYGIVTAPNAQVYVFSNVNFNGAIHAKMVWIDAGSTVTSTINCDGITEGLSFEESCDVLSFQENTWVMNSLDDTAYIAPTDFLKTRTSGVYEVHLGDNIELEMTGVSNVQMDSTDLAGTVNVSVDVYSSGIAGQDTVGSVDLYVKSSTDVSYQYAGGLLYERTENPYDASMSRFTIPLDEDLSNLVKNQQVSIKLVFRTLEPNVTFWVGRMQFCETNGGCNFACSQGGNGTGPAPTRLPKLYELTWLGEENDVVNNASTVGFTITGVNAGVESFEKAIVHITSAMGKSDDIVVAGSTTLANGEARTYTINSAQLPFMEAGFVSNLSVVLYGINTNGYGDRVSTNRTFKNSRYYAKDGDSTVKHFTKELFHEEYSGRMYRVPEGEMGIPIYCERTGALAGYLVDQGEQ